MAIRAVLFDFDGTLADSFAAIAASTNHVRAIGGLPALSEPEVRAYVGHGLPNLLETLAPTLPIEHAIAEYRSHHDRTMMAATKLFPGVMETVTELSRRSYSLGVCSNKAVSFTTKLIAGLGLGELMTEVLGPEDAGNKPKPDPTMLLEACRRFGVTADEAIYVGDMVVDVRAGENAGIAVWIVNPGLVGSDDPRTANPARILGAFSELLALLP